MQTGDWREKTEAAFFGKMGAFADEVRAAGLGFGIWMEPERFGPDAPIRAEHPEWFVPVGASARLDLTQAAAVAYIRREIGRLVETYRLAWMKIDFNFTLDADASGAELSEYATAWYRILDEIRAAYPGTFFEGCSSGAMRGDLATLTHVDGHFLSDSVNPVDVLRISQGAWLRLPPGRLFRWTVIRPAGRQAVPRYGKSLGDSPLAILTPGGAGWEPSETVDLDFALLAAMPGMLGFSGDLGGLSKEQGARIAEGVAFYKTWRRFITGSVAHLLTPPELLACREGWVGVQLQAPGGDTSLLFVYRLGPCGAPPPLRLYGLKTEVRYAITRGFDPSVAPASGIGADLMRDGLRVDGPGAFAQAGSRAEVFCVAPQAADAER
jgi:alpha-galactosidase